MSAHRIMIARPSNHSIGHARRGASIRLLVAVIIETLLIVIALQGLFEIFRFNLGTSHLSPKWTNKRSAFHLTALSNGKELWAQLDNGEIITVNATNGERRRILQPKGHPHISSAASDDGSTYMYTADGRSVAIIHNEELVVYEELPASTKLDLIALSKNGQTALRISDGTDVRCWDLTNSEVGISQSTLSQSVVGVAMAPSGTKFATASTNGSISIFDVKTLELIQNVFVSQEIVGEPAFSVDEHWLAIPCSRSVVLYDLANGKIDWTLPNMGHNGLTRVAISPDGKWVASLEIYSGIQIIERSSGQLKHTVSDIAIKKLAFAPTSTTFYTTAADNLIREWSLATCREINRIELSK